MDEAHPERSTASEHATRQAAGDLLPLVYDELRRLAEARLAGLPPGRTLQPTALVHEAYLKVARSDDVRWHGRGHFFGAAARAMRDILVDEARRRAAIRHGGGRAREDLEPWRLVIEPPPGDVVALHEALTELEADDPRKGEIVNLRYFAGLTVAETAAVLDVSVGTVEREWRYVRAWLHARLND